MNLLSHIIQQIKWSKKTFGPLQLDGVINHLEEELEEVRADPTDLEEWVDVILLGIDGAWRSGHSAEQIVDGIKKKFKKNQERTWPNWRDSDTTKAMGHIKEDK